MQYIPDTSPVTQDFVWFGEYADGQIISEFDFKTKQENSFYSIQREKLIRFGLVGCGMRLYYEVPGGVFVINGHTFHFNYMDGSKYIPLSGGQKMYKDIITFKDAEASISTKGTSSSILQYNFGYKETIVFLGTTFNFRAICKIPFGEPAFFEFRLVANKDLNGSFVITKNNKEVLDISAPLTKEVGGELNYVIKL